MKKLILIIISLVLTAACVQQNTQYKSVSTTIIEGLGSLCSNEEDCSAFCSNNRGACEDYCKENENELCIKIFPNEQPPLEVQTDVEVQQPKCEGAKTKFDYAPVNLEKTLVMLPIGLMTGNHVTPIDHHYFQNFDNDKVDIEVYSPGDGFVTEIGHMPGAKEGEDFRVVIQHTCTISSIYIHIYYLSDTLAEIDLGERGYASTHSPVKAGEIIGYFEKNVDYNLVDEDVTLQGFIVPEHYEGESWKIHVPNTYDYFNEPIRSRLIEKSLRTAEPISGKIDYDIDGRLVGNWFLEGTEGYGGGGAQENYWTSHLSIVYDAYDPQRIVFSIGNYDGKDSEQFAVKGNAPDPANVKIEDGLVKYELVQYDWFTPGGNPWDRKSLAKGLKTVSNENTLGIVLAQMIEDRKIKFESFPGKTASQVSGFTSTARIYER